MSLSVDNVRVVCCQVEVSTAGPIPRPEASWVRAGLLRQRKEPSLRVCHHVVRLCFPATAILDLAQY
jgi:hypothetical protein